MKINFKYRNTFIKRSKLLCETCKHNHINSNNRLTWYCYVNAWLTLYDRENNTCECYEESDEHLKLREEMLNSKGLYKRCKNIFCNNIFLARSSNHVFCSYSCRNEYNGWRCKNRELARAYEKRIPEVLSLSLKELDECEESKEVINKK